MFKKLVEIVLKQKPVISITFLFLLIYLFLSWKLNIWEDEAYTLKTISNDTLKGLIRASILFEGQPPFYFIIASFWSKISNSVFFMRLLSTLFTISSGLVFYKLYKRNSVNASWWILILVYGNPFMIYLATEIRCYSLVVLFLLLLIRLFQQYYCNQNVPALIRVLYITLSIAAVNTQYFIAFLLLANGICLLIKGYRKTFITYFVDMLFVLISLSWTVFYISGQFNIHHYREFVIGFEDIIRFVFSRLDDYVFYRYLFPFKILGYIVEILIGISIFIHFISKRHIHKFFVDNFYLIVQTVVIAFCLTFIFPILGHEFLAIRHTAVLFPSLFLLFIRSFDYFQKRYIKGLLIFTISLFYLTGNINSYKFFVKDLDIKGSIKYISGKLKENESVLLINARLTYPFIHYFKEQNEIYILPMPVDFSKEFDYEILQKPMQRDSIEKLFNLVSQNNSFWIINLYRPEWFIPDLININSIIDSYYTLESDTLISDTKRFKTYFASIQIRKLKHK